MIRLPISLSKKYQVNQVNHEVAKKHHTESTYNKPNILILIKIPCKYLVIIIPFPKVIPPCNYLVKHLFQQFISSITSITRISKMANHTMNNITQGQTILLLNSLQMFMVLNGGTEIEKYRFLAHKIM